jgi:transposase-like protein
MVVGRLSTGADDSVCTGAGDGAMAEVLTVDGPWVRNEAQVNRRRVPTARERQGEADDCSRQLAPGAVVAEVARQVDVTSSQIYRCHQEVPAAVAGFALLLTAALKPQAMEIAAARRCCGEAAIKMEFAGKMVARIPGSIARNLATAYALARLTKFISILREI